MLGLKSCRVQQLIFLLSSSFRQVCLLDLEGHLLCSSLDDRFSLLNFKLCCQHNLCSLLFWTNRASASYYLGCTSTGEYMHQTHLSPRALIQGLLTIIAVGSLHAVQWTARDWSTVCYLVLDLNPLNWSLISGFPLKFPASLPTILHLVCCHFEPVRSQYFIAWRSEGYCQPKATNS